MFRGMFSEKDLIDLQERGISSEKVEEQLQMFKRGFPFLPVARPATPGDGILRPHEDTLQDFISLYESKAAFEKILKFVPASGAATRMFSQLYAFLENGNEQDNNSINAFISGLPRLALYHDLKSCLGERGLELDSLVTSGDYKSVLKCLLDKDGLNYGNLPKGLLSFHKYDSGYRTAFEEHLVEGALYCRGNNDISRIHMTVSPEHKSEFEKTLQKVGHIYENNYNLKLEVEFSTQKPSTDTIAADAENRPFRDADGRLVFRPGGHGALIGNLAELDADVIFIKNIDNVVPDNFKEETVRYKKALGGMLLSFRERIFYYLNVLVNTPESDAGLLEEIMTFLQDELCMVSPWGSDQWGKAEIRDYLITKLDRPLRICGMVKNEGEPGGGPFWVKNKDGSVALQIVESSQVNLENPLMRKLFNASTHFNPVDLVCSAKDYKGGRYDLHKFRDPDTGFISRKSAGGRELKALELPGLWNGAMADWNTVFVEVPLSTFNPVKTINDLLRPQHSGT
jgi:hypothetical protein